MKMTLDSLEPVKAAGKQIADVLVSCEGKQIASIANGVNADGTMMNVIILEFTDGTNVKITAKALQTDGAYLEAERV